MSTSSDDLTPEDIRNEANSIVDNILPSKSKHFYMKCYEEFMSWKTKKGVKFISESLLLVYFQELSNTKKSSSLWSFYSMLRSTINIKNNIDISKYVKLKAFLKRKSEGHRPKKSKVFTAHNMETFLNNAPDDTFLDKKVS